MRPKQNKNQDGFASIVIALVLILVLSLLTVGFAQLMRREQRSALDKQLSNQAYYAAESGVNDAAKAINAGYTLAKTTCGVQLNLPGGVSTGQSGYTYLSNPSVGNNTQSSYPCLLIDPAPDGLDYSSIDDVEGISTEITGANSSDPTQPALVGSLVISWQDANGGQGFVSGSQASNHQFTPASGQGHWNATPILRAALTPLESGNLNRGTLIDSTYTGFLYPNQASSTSAINCNPSTAPSNCSPDSYAGGSGSGGIYTGRVVNGGCNAGSTPNSPLYCNVTITGLAWGSYVINLRSIYGNSRVHIEAYGTDGSRLRIKNAQFLVDSTGKAQDVLKRIQVRIPAHNNYPEPGFEAEAMSGICKQLQIWPNGSDAPGCTP